MNYTEQEAIEIAKKALDKIKFDYNRKKPFKAYYEEKGGLDIDPEPRANVWVVSFYSYDMAFERDEFVYLNVSDDTGRPLQIQESLTSIHILTDKELGL